MLNISRGSLYYKPRPVSAAYLALMRRMDELHLDIPGYRNGNLMGCGVSVGGASGDALG